MIPHRYELSDAQWDQIKPLFPINTTGRPLIHSNRIMFNAFVWLARTGCPWRDLPQRFGPWKSVYTRITRWSKAGVFTCIFRYLTQDADMEFLHIDSTAIIAHQHSAGAKDSGPESEPNQIGRSRGGNSTKIHALVDALGNPVSFVLSEGNPHDSPIALALLPHVSLENVNVVGDKAYSSQSVRDYIERQGGTYTIPPKKSVTEPWSVDWWIYKERHSIECFFNRLKHFRRIATRYDKSAYMFRTFIYVASILLLTR